MHVCQEGYFGTAMSVMLERLNRSLALFYAFASTEKTLHANPGKHADLPWFKGVRHICQGSRIWAGFSWESGCLSTTR